MNKTVMARTFEAVYVLHDVRQVARFRAANGQGVSKALADLTRAGAVVLSANEVA